MKIKFFFIVAVWLVVIDVEGYSYQNPVVCYYLGDFDGYSVSASDSNVSASPLPDSLVIPPGIYNFRGKQFECTTEGVYRFYHVPKENQQRIVFDGDLDQLIISLGWMIAKGNQDDRFPTSSLIEAAKTRVVSITCGPSGLFAERILQSQGYQARFVKTLTLDEWTSYSNGHGMVEVFHPDLDKWVLADPSKKITYLEDGKRINFIEAIDAAKKGTISVQKISCAPICDIGRFHLADGWDYNFVNQHVYECGSEIINRIRRYLQVPIFIKNGVCIFTCEPEEIRRVKEYYPHAVHMTRERLISTFYP